ncbi:serine/threonine-protein phosphatase with EF-hands 2-like [Ylistrum balloti]|uniref:serine/threonine-protein phosphatase with EF-hands 2-like n=1 Tax=Ylistrum balloti TaxID=509963 RepID=UPI002905E3BF|nr:serine/threonine-protein phosphatase with EF-hands 2-like [Ylistrum balloti]
MGCTSSKTVAPEESSTKSEKVIRSAILIQKWYRRYMARLEMRRRCTWNIFQSIEYSGEQNQLKLYNFFTDMLKQMTPDGTGQPKILRALSDSSRRPINCDVRTLEAEDAGLLLLSNPDDIEVGSHYNGIHLTFPLNQSQLQDLIQSFKTKKCLHAKYLLQLLHETRAALKQKSNINHATISISKQITVCGDLHGKLDDLYMVFHKNGLPSVDNPYIFNGDFVDRGNNSVEISVILFTCFLLNPNEVYINRGNHEDHIMNIRYGFVKEVNKKYSAHANCILRLFEDLFSWLPLATIIDDKVLVVHGGFSNTTDLDVIAKIDRHKFLSTLHPSRGFDDENLTEVELQEWKQVLDLLWSDPRMQDGCLPNTFRGGGSYFGPDVTTMILNKHNLQRLIRSHECKVEGYEYTHNDKVLTIFSASNYYEVGSNKGAYIKMTGPDLSCHIVQYMVNKQSTKRKITFTKRISQVEKIAMRDLKRKILGCQTELMTHFKAHDSENKGIISVIEWCNVLEGIMQMELPWRTMRPHLAKCDVNGAVLYGTTFSDMKLYHGFTESGHSITELLYRNKDSLETIFRIFDKDNSGTISMEEFEEALDVMINTQEISVSRDQVKDIAHSLDLNNDGFIDFNEFLEAFRIVDPYGKETRKSLSGNSETDSLGTDDNELCTPGKKADELRSRKISKLHNIEEMEISEA